MCVSRFEESPKKFNEGSAVRLIDVLRKQSYGCINTEKPESGIDVWTEEKKNQCVEVDWI